MKYSRLGHTTVEYAICLSLLAVLALASLKLLGGNINNLLGATTSGKSASQINQLYALIGANPNIGGSSGSTGGTNTPSVVAGVGNKIQLHIDPSTGQVIMTDTTGGSKNTTSVDGSTSMVMISKQLGLLADVKLANNHPLPSEVQALIKQLMLDGINLSNAFNGSLGVMDQYNAINAANTGKTSGFESYPGAVVQTLGNNLSQGIQFQNDYNRLNTLLNALAKTDPTVQSRLIDPISQLAGGLSSIPYNAYGKNLASDFNINAASTSDLVNVYQTNPLIGTVIPMSTVISSVSMDPASRDRFIQDKLTTVAQSVVVGTIPTGNSAISIDLAMPTNGTTASSTISGEIPPTSSGAPAVNFNASINITTDGISATASSSTIPPPPPAN